MEPPLRWSSVTLPGRVKKHLRTLISTSKELEGVVPGSGKDMKVGVVWSWPRSWVDVSEVLVSSSGRETNTIRQAAVILRNQGSDAPPVASRTSWIFCVGAGTTARLQEDTWNSQHVHGLARQCQAGQSTACLTWSEDVLAPILALEKLFFSHILCLKLLEAKNQSLTSVTKTTAVAKTAVQQGVAAEACMTSYSASWELGSMLKQRSMVCPLKDIDSL